MTQETLKKMYQLLLTEPNAETACFQLEAIAREALAQPPLPVQEPVAMRMPKVGDKVICLEDESLGEVVSLTAGGSPDITFDDGSHGTYLLREFAELFGYVTSLLPVQEPPQYSFKAHWTDDKRIGVVACVTRPDGGVHLLQTIIDPPSEQEQRQWVGLTGLEQKAIMAMNSRNAVFETEAKLKGKNHG